MRKINRQRRSQSLSIPPPTGGLNDKNSLADMPSTDAIILENFFPGTNSVDVRGGSTQFATGLSATGETLMAYNGVTKKLFAASGGNIYDVTAGGAVGAAVVSAKSNARWDYVNFGNNGAQYLVAVNGTDLPMFWNGTSWQPSGSGYATAITGVNAALFSQVAVWKNRLFFVEKGTLRAWYLPVGNIGGAAAYLDFSGFAKLGGKLIAITTVTTSAGFTLDDYFVAITSEGECLIYRGTDPANASTFAMNGNYRIGRPIANGADNVGGRWITKYGADIVAVTADGFTTLQAAFNADVIAQQRTINDKIINTVNNAVETYKANFGWQAILAPVQNKLIINVPTASDNTQSYQYVMNTITGAWCKFTGWNATCFEIFNDGIYAIIGNAVYQMDIPQSNDFVYTGVSGTIIQAVAKPAFQYVGGRNALKSFKFIRPYLLASGAMQPIIGINVDLQDTPVTGNATISSAAGAVWDTDLWDTGVFATEEQAFTSWISVNGMGYCFAPKMIVQTNNQYCRWMGYDVIFERGGIL